MPSTGRRVPGHADLLRRPLLRPAARRQREPQRQDPSLPAQEDQFRRSDPGRARRDRPGDQRHSHEDTRLQNTQRGMGRGDSRITITEHQLDNGRCTSKLNPGENIEHKHDR